MAFSSTCTEQNLTVVHENDEERVEHVQRGQWIRAAILGVNDGLISTTSLMLGVAAARENDHRAMILSGLAGAVAGSCSMAVGEFVSVSTQKDVVEMARNRKFASLPTCTPKTAVGTQLDGTCLPSISSPTLTPYKSPEGAQTPMTPGRKRQIFSPGRSPMMRIIAADSNTSKEKNGIINPEEEIVIVPDPIKAAVASGMSFLVGAAIPLLSAMFVHENDTRCLVLAIVTSVTLALFGGLGAHLGGSRMWVSALRVLVGGWIAMGVTYGSLKLLDRDDGVKDGDKH
ncbi:hypothetical protein GIB67_037816 [Kingdonia uniflora]|uniref:Vacuolar iron transporter n=1 Tax=Kingdonia uniflora TaxID=39325 RepID=A0A7J7NAK6_9MAGN|nr:hypothetical protein GIB67_017375 [Kingdonia uniflora]KAF6164050.1 hypothetical protein GIB67_037816 [Kingdonia uniflora]